MCSDSTRRSNGQMRCKWIRSATIDAIESYIHMSFLNSAPHHHFDAGIVKTKDFKKYHAVSLMLFCTYNRTSAVIFAHCSDVTKIIGPLS